MTNIVRVRERHPTLEKIGLAASFYPSYINPGPSPHTVDTSLLSLIIKGSGKHIMGPDVYEERGSSLAVTWRGEPHTIVTRGPMEILNIFLDLSKLPLPDLTPEFNKTVRRLLPERPSFRNRLNRLLRIEFDDINAAAAAGLAIEREQREKKSGYLTAMTEYFKLFLIECCRQAESSGIQTTAAPDSPLTARLERARALMDSSFQEKLCLEEMAKAAGLSAPYLCRAFKEYSGQTVFEYLTAKRVQNAAALLREGNAKIFSCAYDSGFRDMSYFNRTFKRLTGQTPARHRKES
jgi:AraC-like DNA-binding protein